MIRTKIDALWFKRCCAFHLQFFPDGATLSKLISLQDDIERYSDAPLLRLPAASLHMTIVTLVNAAAKFSIPNEEVWRLNGERWKAVAHRLAEQTPAFNLHLRKLAVSAAAVFVKAEEPPELRKLRSAIIQAIDFEGWRPTPPQIAHITLFRFSAEGRLPEITADAGSLPKAVRVRSLQLLEERVYPSVEINVLSEPLLSDKAGSRDIC
ncbi:RNA ligase family protein [Rhizobium phaseoli]|uniref:2'-5' RNA ligase family protein n=1 Tax=Rhizobium phaseoli TaxID=396 RepID=UPI0007EB82A5|nr:2'-5' RNA ligase family protein [Rhizobium phaseoli]ANL64651.1 RNA ligase family protein [Rhizobium phaseoli]ANL77466.1 RNA ligase family protein [Rhizobium phaseoli]ANM03103.1 RNA ligase family protein [Rhizobium phaseoli]